jgi:hypothetical protein
MRSRPPPPLPFESPSFPSDKTINSMGIQQPRQRGKRTCALISDGPHLSPCRAAARDGEDLSSFFFLRAGLGAGGKIQREKLAATKAAREIKIWRGWLLRCLEGCLQQGKTQRRRILCNRDDRCKRANSHPRPSDPDRKAAPENALAL